MSEENTTPENEQVDVPQTEVPAIPETVPEGEGKPVGPATIVGDDPIEQFPTHDASIQQ